MKQRTIALLALAALLALTLWLPGMTVSGVLAQGATPTPAAEEEEADEELAEEEEEDEEVEEEADIQGDELEPNLVTARVVADLVRPGRLIMSARGNHWIYDSVAPLNGPNEAVNPMDAILGALISCGMFIYEAVAIENEIALDSISATAAGELDLRGVSGAAAVNPRIRALYVTMNVEGPTAEEAAMMAEAFSRRCPIYTTLAMSAPIEVINVVDGEEQEAFATEATPIIEADKEEIELSLARPSARGRLVEFGRAMISARGNHWIYDSVPPINGPNEEVNPMDAFVGTLPGCGIMVYEAVTRDLGIPLHSINATAEADFDPRGVAGSNVNPRIRAFRVTMNVDGPTAEEAEMLADEWRARCPIYTTFERAAPIEITNRLMGEGSAILEVEFTYNVDTEEYLTLASDFAEAFLSVDGMLWKLWKINADESRAGGVYLFKDAAARQAYLDGDLFAAVQSHPSFSDFRIHAYDVVRDESILTHAPLMAATGASDDVEPGMLLQVNFAYNVSAGDFLAAVSPLAEDFVNTEGLRWKIWALDEEGSQFSGILYFEDAESMDAFLGSELAEIITTHPALSDFEITFYGVMAEESLITRAPIQ
ncbi:MAG: YdhR family protein [Caldilineaceae bacterium]|nr:YdhR family protein [Caldilineaceae bacterium]